MGTNFIEILKKGHEAFNAKDFDLSASFVAEHVKIVDHGRNQTATTREEFKDWLKSHYAMSSNIQLVDRQYIDGGKWVTVTFRAVGNQDGPLLNFPPSGKPFSLDICEVWHFNEDGQAIEGHNYSDGLGMLMQLGFLPIPS